MSATKMDQGDTLTIRIQREVLLVNANDPEAVERAEREGAPRGKLWEALIGPNFVEGVAGYGATPLLALQNLVENIGKFEGHHTDNGVLFLR